MAETHAAGFVGRQVELERLWHALEQAAQGMGTFIVVEGEPGIGKTRLVERALATSPVDIATSLWGAADELDRVQPFRSLHAPAAALGLSEVASVAQAPRDLGGAEDRLDAGFVWIEELLDALQTRAGQGLVVLVIDDLQWADRADSTDSVAHLGEASTGSSGYLAGPRTRIS